MIEHPVEDTLNTFSTISKEVAAGLGHSQATRQRRLVSLRMLVLSTMSHSTAYIHLKYGLDALKYRELYEAGKVPDETPYGLHHAEKMGFNVSYSFDHAESSFTNFSRKVIKRVLGFDLIHAYRNRKKIIAADVVWTMTEIEYLAICALPFLVPNMKRPCLIAQTVWLFNRWVNYSPLRQWMLQKLIRRSDALTFHSKQYLKLVPELIPWAIPHLLYFGVSLDSFPWNRKPLKQHKPIRLLSMGNDPSRDWTTLVSAFGNDDRFDLKIVCSWLSDTVVGGYRNINCPRNPTMQEYRDLYNWADLVIVTMTENYYSGITVALEATSMGVPVVASHTGGISTYFTSDEMLYVAPENPSALRDAVLGRSLDDWSALVSNAQVRFLREDYSSEGMARRYVELSESLMKL